MVVIEKVIIVITAKILKIMIKKIVATITIAL